MTTIAGNTRDQITLPQGQRLTVVAATDASGVIERLGAKAGDDLLGRTLIASGETKYLGPYTAPARFQISCTLGSLEATADFPDLSDVAGTTTNDEPVAGDVGEQITASVAQGSAVALSTGTAKNVTSITLTPGDWEVEGVVGFIPAASTSITGTAQGASATADTLGAAGSYLSEVTAAVVPGAVPVFKQAPKQRFSVASSTVVYLVASATFTVSTLGAFGTIRARRVR